MTLAVRYMGSKRSLAPAIADRIATQFPAASILDVFSGMCAVASELAPTHTVLTNDIHAFAETVARALFVAPGPSPTSLSAREDLSHAFSRNAKELNKAFRHRLLSETVALARLSDTFGWKKLRSFTAEEHQTPAGSDVEGLAGIKEYRSNPKTFPYCLASTYFASGYFGLAQCIEIDSLRYAIDQADAACRPFYLTALMQSMSKCAAAPGHFAQFLVPRDQKNTSYIGRIRLRSVLGKFLEALDEIRWLPSEQREGNDSFCGDATAILENVVPKLNVGELVIYADPPYSKAQYSRYYHVLETITRYDYPIISGKGRYRDGREQTGWSRTAEVEQVFSDFLRAASATGAPLYLSYPTNGLLTTRGVTLPDLLRCHYKEVFLEERVEMNHSTLGASAGKAFIPVFEDIYYANNG